MNIKFTARHFRPHPELKEHALDQVRKLAKFYDGIVSATIVLSYERATNSIKQAEINLSVMGSMLTATEKSEDYHKSVDLAIDKLNLQLAKYKTKLRSKDKAKVRAINAKV